MGKQHGFDPDKFRMANASIHRSSSLNSKLDNMQQDGSTDVISSFASSELSSKSETIPKRKERKKEKYQDIDIDAFLAEDQDDDDDDLLLQELSRPNSKGYNTVNYDDRSEQMGYIDGIEE